MDRSYGTHFYFTARKQRTEARCYKIHRSYGTAMTNPKEPWARSNRKDGVQSNQTIVPPDLLYN